MNYLEYQNIETSPQTVFLLQNWNYGLFSCFDFPLLYTKTTVCPCIVYADNYYRVNGKNYYKQLILYLCCGCILQGNLRNQIQDQFGLIKYPIDNYTLSCILGPCVLAQDKLELDYHNMAPPIYHNMV